MAYDYNDAATVAAELLADFGQPVTHHSTSEGSYDPASGSVTRTPLAQSGTGVLLKIALSQIDGTVITASDRRLLLSREGIAVAPKPNDSVSINGVTYTVMQAQLLAPGSVTLLHELVVRR